MTDRRSIALFAAFFVGYNLALASVLLATYPVPSGHTTLYFGNGDFAPWTVVYNPQFSFMQSRPFQLEGGSVLTGSFEVYRMWNGSEVPQDPPQEVQVKLVPAPSLYPGPTGVGPPIWFARYASVVTVSAYDVTVGSPFTLIVSTYTADCVHNCTVNVSGALTTTTPPPSQPLVFPLAAAGVILMASPGLWAAGRRLRRNTGEGPKNPDPPPT